MAPFPIGAYVHADRYHDVFFETDECSRDPYHNKLISSEYLYSNMFCMHGCQIALKHATQINTTRKMAHSFPSCLYRSRFGLVLKLHRRYFSTGSKFKSP